MYALNVFAAIATLATGINAAAFRRNIHVADFRSFGEPGCSAKNLGVWTVIDDDIVENGCNDFNGDVVKSLSLTDINEGYTLYLYTDAECKTDGQAVSEQECKSAEDEWKAWVVKAD